MAPGPHTFLCVGIAVVVVLQVALFALSALLDRSSRRTIQHLERLLGQAVQTIATLRLTEGAEADPDGGLRRKTAALQRLASKWPTGVTPEKRREPTARPGPEEVAPKREGVRLTAEM